MNHIIGMIAGIILGYRSLKGYDISVFDYWLLIVGIGLFFI